MIVVAALIVDSGRILVARRSGGHLDGKWEFPGGKLEAGEAPEACIAREIREELGIDIETADLFSRDEHRYGEKAVDLMVFRARLRGRLCGRLRDAAGPAADALTLTAHSEARWVSPAELLSLDLAPADLPAARKAAAEL